MSNAGRTAQDTSDTAVTMREFSAAERAAWQVAVDRGLAVTPADVLAMISAARGSRWSSQYQKVTRLCTACGYWRCAACGWERHNANAHAAAPDCARCGSASGSFRAGRHSRRTWEDHNPGLNWDEAQTE